MPPMAGRSGARTRRGSPPYGRGGFFSSPAIAFGHVYAARDDGTVFGLRRTNRQGRLVLPDRRPGLRLAGAGAGARHARRAVYIGSENGHLYALDARNGKPRWRYDVGGPVPGTATVIGHTVYSSSFKTGNTVGIDARSHRKTFELHQAGYTPVVSDGQRLYLVGYFDLVGLDPTGR